MTVHYQRGLFRIRNLTQIEGSAALQALPIAIVCSIWAVIAFKLRNDADAMLFTVPFKEVMTNNAAFTTYSGCAVFLVTFRSLRAYDRFLKGTLFLKKMQAEFFITASNLVAFSRAATAEKQIVMNFQHKLIRLLSMLQAVCLHQLEFGGEGVDIRQVGSPTLPMIDALGIDVKTLAVIREEECRVEMIVQWIQSLTVDGIKGGVCTIPPPILSRIFQNLSNGMTFYYGAYRVTEVPFPFPFVQLIDYLILVTCIVTPISLQSFCSNEFWAFMSTFIVVLVFVSLNCIAVELENPFSNTVNNVQLRHLQQEFNKRLTLLIKPESSLVPTLAEGCIQDHAVLIDDVDLGASFAELWDVDEDDPEVPHVDDDPDLVTIHPKELEAAAEAERKASAPQQNGGPVGHMADPMKTIIPQDTIDKASIVGKPAVNGPGKGSSAHGVIHPADVKLELALEGSGVGARDSKYGALGQSGPNGRPPGGTGDTKPCRNDSRVSNASALSKGSSQQSHGGAHKRGSVVSQSDKARAASAARRRRRASSMDSQGGAHAKKAPVRGHSEGASGGHDSGSGKGGGRNLNRMPEMIMSCWALQPGHT
eukprot:TRINITY_DN80750_c0_g1_i1.p1 TRINITY_DN80750_c0_g1~~TRINITY_DN80750_c0_g1_i1.p1  ORF type:complete len:592 (-),score=63.07 TRINITY_DN80750_c0_g1_i1:400-2175(-)